MNHRFTATTNAILMALLLVLTVSDNLSAQTLAALRPKNIVFIMLDDADYFDFRFTQSGGMSLDSATPNMDSLRRGGRLYTQFRTASAVCSPTRMSVLTGCNPIRFGGIDAWSSLVSESGLPSNIPQLGLMMKAAGKKTGFYGKWHVGNARSAYLPGNLGFDRHCRYTRKLPTDEDRNTWWGRFRFVSESYNEVHDVDYVDRYFANEALSFIDECHQSEEEFFLAYFPYSPHYPWAPPRDYQNPRGFDLEQPRGQMLSMMHAVDREIGRLITRLRIRGLLDDTMIVLSSDNGGTRRTQHAARKFRGSKATLLDGGLRVPLVVHWPGHVPQNSTNDSFLLSYDLLPTFVELSGLEPHGLTPHIDGRSFVETMSRNFRLPHLPAYWELSGGPARVTPARWGRTQAYQRGDYKLIREEGRAFWEPKGLQLFDLRNDPGERNDLAKDPQHQSRLALMRHKMLEARKEIANYSQLPTFAASEEVIPYDSRLDVAERDMTLEFDLLIPSASDSVLNVYSQRGVQRLMLTKTQRLTWQVNGYDPFGNSTSVVLKSKSSLQPGQVYRVVLSVGGYRRDLSKIEMYIDNVRQDDADNYFPGIFKLRTSIANGLLGDQGVVLDRIKWSTLRLWSSEWD